MAPSKQVVLVTATGTETVKANTVVGDFAVHRALNAPEGVGWWQISHVPTGRALLPAHAVPTHIAHAKLIANLLAEGEPWPTDDAGLLREGWRVAQQLNAAISLAREQWEAGQAAKRAAKEQEQAA